MIKYFVFVFYFFAISTEIYAQTETIFEDFSLKQIKRLLMEQKPKTVPELLALLPENFRSSYTLVYQSESIQDASFQNPRVIFFGRTGRFIMTFNGDPTQSGYQDIEMMQFHSESKSLELRKLTFHSGTAELSERNPFECTMCHGSEPRPIWHSYAYWPGTYGANDDLTNQTPNEFSQFQLSAPSHDRYRYLNSRNDLSQNWPYSGSPFHHYARPNNRLGRLLAGIGGQIAYRVVKDSAFYKKFPNSILYHFLNCPLEANQGYRTKIDELFRIRFPQSEFPFLYDEIATINADLLKVTYQIEKLVLDSHFKQWDLLLGFSNGARFHADGGRTHIEMHIAMRLFDEIAPQDPELRPFYESWDSLQTYVYAAGEQYRYILETYAIDKAYDEVNLFINVKKAKEACPIILERMNQELH